MLCFHENRGLEVLLEEAANVTLQKAPSRKGSSGSLLVLHASVFFRASILALI